MKLSHAQLKFILHWGEMGHRWGINRAMAQVHALLYLSEQPLCAETLSETLSMARSSISTSLRELQAWGVVKVAHVLGDRRDHFEAEKDVWALFRFILDERKKREIDPTIATLRECLADDRDAAEDGDYARERIADMLDFFETTSGWYQTMGRLPRGALMRLVKLGARARGSASEESIRKALGPES